MATPHQPTERHDERAARLDGRRPPLHVAFEFVVIDAASDAGRELHGRQSAAIRNSLRWFAEHPPPEDPPSQIST